MDRSLARKALAGCVTLLALSAPVAIAAPPINDNYLSSSRLNEPGKTLDSTHTLVDDKTNTAEATVQPDVFAPPKSGGPAELTACQGAGYGHTVWYDFYPDTSGLVQLQASGYDAVVSLVEFNRQTLMPDLGSVQCSNASGGGATEKLLTAVTGGKAYTIQIGAVGDGGPLVFQFDFLRDTDRDGVLDNVDSCPRLAARGSKRGCPPRLSADATLRAQPTANGVMLLGLSVSAPHGARVRVTCSAGCSPQARTASAVGFPKLRGAQLRAGSTLAIFVTRPGAIGTYLRYRIARGNFAKVKRCLNPGSRTPRTSCR
jgi:hypothetical protein